MHEGQHHPPSPVNRDGFERIPRIITVTSPAAGAEWTQNVQSGAVWYVQAITQKVVTSAVVANRVPTITYTDGTTIFARLPPANNQAASLTNRYGYYLGYGVALSISGIGGVSSPLPNIPLLSGMSISSLTVNLDVGDQISEVNLYVIEVEERAFENQEAWLAPRYTHKSHLAYPSVRED